MLITVFSWSNILDLLKVIDIFRSALAALTGLLQDKQVNPCHQQSQFLVTLSWELPGKLSELQVRL